MSLTKTWYTFDEAVSKYGVSIGQLNQWVESGLIRTEGDKGVNILLNANDIEQELQMVPSA